MSARPWYQQNPVLKFGQAPGSGPTFATPAAEIAFWKEQYERTVALVLAKDATEAACVKRVTEVYVPIQERLKRELEARIKSAERAQLMLADDAARYQLLRSVRVRAMQLGVDNLSGKALDAALDAQKPEPAKPVSDASTLHVLNTALFPPTRSEL